VVYVSGWARDVVERERAIQPRESTVVWNGLPDLSPKAPKARSEMRTALGLADGELALVNVGTLEPRKNQAGLVDLFADVAAEFPRARLLLIGDGPHRSVVEARVAERKLQDKVRFLGMRRDVPAILAAADMYVHFAIAENCPVVLIEAARAGLPIAAAPVGGVPELMRELGSDVNLDLANPAASLQGLRQLLSDAARRNVLGDLARQNFVRRFTRDAMVRQYLAALEGGTGMDPCPGPGRCREPSGTKEVRPESGSTRRTYSDHGHEYMPVPDTNPNRTAQLMSSKP
jgi:glycosyltransferase involved in cell wall biosynthesis